MNLIELSNACNGRLIEGKKAVSPVEERLTTIEELQRFKNTLAIHDIFQAAFQATENASEFYDSVELLKDTTPKAKREDIFYAAKLGFFYDGVPSKLVYLLKKSMKVNPSPNAVLSSILPSTLEAYVKVGALREGITVKTVLENLYGRPVTLFSDSIKKVDYDDFSEIYVANVDRVVLVPKDIAEKIVSIEDIENVQYVPDVGVCVGDIPLRVMGDRCGITYKEFDLRECV